MKRRIAVIALLLGACSAGAPASAPETTATSAAPDTTAPAETTTSAAPVGASVEVAVNDSELGPILTDADGNVLYLFTPDEAGDSTCYDGCADAWPPLLGEPTAGAGADASLLGTTERTDGSTQATYAGWPLYYFAADAQAGDTSGQGLNSVWFVVSPEGEAIGS